MEGPWTHNVLCHSPDVRFGAMNLFPDLVAFDIDGTLLRSDGSLSARVCQAIKGIKCRGCTVVLSTGRPWKQVKTIVEELAVVDYCICLNGASIFKSDGSLLKSNAMPEELTLTGPEIARKLFPNIALAADMADGRHIWDEHFVHDFPSDFEMEPIRVSDALSAIDGPVLTWLLDCKDADPRTVTSTIRGLLPHGIEVRPSGLETPEIVKSGVSKGSALNEVANMTGIAPAQAWAFGDGLNDIEMFQWAGYSFAMENGHPELLSIADRVAPSHDADGIAVVLEDLLVS